MEEMVAQCMDMMNEVGGMMGSGMMGGMMDGGMMRSTAQSVMMMPFWIFAWLLVLGVIAAVILAVWAARRAAVPALQGAETPLAILKRRYAAGEIDAEQFQKIRAQLGES